MLQLTLNTWSASGTSEDEKWGGFHLSPSCSVMLTSCYIGVVSTERVSNRKYCSLVPVAVCDGNQSTVTP